MNTAFWMVQNKGMYLEPNFHLVNWPGKTARALAGLWWHFTSPINYLHLYLTRLQSMLARFHPHASFFLLLLFDGDALSEEKQINPWELEPINLRKTQIHLLYSERANRNEASCAPHSDWKRIITYYSFLDPWRTSGASLMLHCSFLVPINRKHAPNS